MKQKDFNMKKLISIILLCLSFLLPVAIYYIHYKKETVDVEKIDLGSKLQDFDIILVADDDPLNYYIMNGENIDYSHSYIYIKGNLYSATFRWLIDQSIFTVTEPEDIKAYKIYIYRLKDRKRIKELYSSLRSVLERLKVIKERVIPFDYSHVWRDSRFFSSEGLFCLEFALLPYIEAGIVDISKLYNEVSREKIFKRGQWELIEIDSRE